MRRFARGLALLAAILTAGCMLAGCGSGARSAIASLAPTSSASASSGQSTSSSPSPSISPTPSVSPSPGVTVTVTGTPSAAPSTSTATASVQPSGSPAAGSGSGSSLIWLWILLAVVVLAAVIVAIVSAGRRRSAAAAAWRSRVIDAYAKGSALHDAMSVAEAPGALGAYDAGARWSDIQRRADDLAQTLYALREAAPDDDDQARVADVLTALSAVRSAMDAERAPGGATAQQAEVTRERLAFFEISLSALRTSDQQAF
jgi:hypothetical protein